MAVPTARPTPRSRPQILIASAQKMEPRDQESRRRRTQPWQVTAFEYVRAITELNYASRFYSKMLKRLRIYPALRSADDKLDPITEGPPVDLLDRIQDPAGGRSSILGQYGRLMFIAGEGYLLGRNLQTDQDRWPEERWSFVSSREVELHEDGGLLHKPNKTGKGTEYTDAQAVAYRLWTPEPEFSGEPESPVASALEIAEELLILTKAVRSTAVSRMINGMLKVPAELSFGSDEAGVDEDAEANPLLADIIDHITGAIENAGTAEASSPLLAEGEAEFLSALEWMGMHDPQNDYMEQGLRKEAIERLAHGLDFPAEYLLSLGKVNHWSARAITHEMWRTHGAPLAESFCDDLSEEYLRRALREAKYPEWARVVVAYDDANVVVPVDRTDDADKAADHGNISDEGYRTMKGIDESMSPSEEEKRIYLAVKLRDVALLKGTRYEVEVPEPTVRPPGPDATVPEPPDAEEGPPTPGPAGVSRQESRTAALHGFAYASLIRCREQAGARVRQYMGHRTARPRYTAELARLDGHDNTDVAVVLGREVLGTCGFTEPFELVKNGAKAFTKICQAWGIEEAQSRALAQMIEVFAAKTLYEPGVPTFPSGFYAQIARAVEVSNELGEEGIVRRNNAALAQLEKLVPADGDPVTVSS
jgi:hypothetical protein